jgi:hypothetical protein
VPLRVGGSNAFAFGELLFFEGPQRKVTAPLQDSAAPVFGAPPRAALSRHRGSALSFGYFSLGACKEK